MLPVGPGPTHPAVSPSPSRKYACRVRLAPRYFLLAVLLDLVIVFALGALVDGGLAVDAYLLGAGLLIPAACRSAALALQERAQQRLVGGPQPLDRLAA